jgi:threonine/homoserine/homoserine lactone efflux protein
MNVELFAAFLLAALVIQFTPGPGMLFIIAQGLTGGSRAGRAAACGAASGMLVHTCAVVLGLAAVLRAAPMAMDLLRFAGAAYLLWLALRSLRTSELAPGVPGLPMPDRFGPVFLRGLINNLANPKIVLFYVAFLPTVRRSEPGSSNAAAVRARADTAGAGLGHRPCHRRRRRARRAVPSLAPGGEPMAEPVCGHGLRCTGGTSGPQ